MQIDCISSHSIHGVVLSKDVLRGLFVVLPHHRAMSVALLIVLVGARVIASLVRTLGLPSLLAMALYY